MGGTNTSTTQTVNEPYKAFRPLLNTAARDALEAYRSGAGSNVYTGSTVIPFSRQTQNAYDGLMGIANQNSNGRGMNRQMQNIIDNGGFNNSQRDAMRSMRQQMNRLGSNGLSGLQDNAVGQLRNLQGQIGQSGLTNAQRNAMGDFQGLQNRLGNNGLSNVQDQALRNYRQTANASYDMNANPGFADVLSAAQDSARNAANLTASATGRYGSGVHQGAVAQNVGDLTNRMVSDDYNRFLGRQDNANAAMANLGQQGVGNTSNLAGSIAALGQQGLQNRQGLANEIGAYGQQGVNNLQSSQSNLFNAAQAGLGNMTNAYSAMQQPYQTQLGVGRAYEDLATRQMNDRLRIFNEQNNAPWNQINRLLGVAGAGSGYNTQNTVATQPGQSPFLTTLGGISTGVGLLGSLGLF